MCCDAYAALFKTLCLEGRNVCSWNFAAGAALRPGQGWSILVGSREAGLVASRNFRKLAAA